MYNRLLRHAILFNSLVVLAIGLASCGDYATVQTKKSKFSINRTNGNWCLFFWNRQLTPCATAKAQPTGYNTTQGDDKWGTFKQMQLNFAEKSVVAVRLYDKFDLATFRLVNTKQSVNFFAFDAPDSTMATRLVKVPVADSLTQPTQFVAYQDNEKRVLMVAVPPAYNGMVSLLASHGRLMLTPKPGWLILAPDGLPKYAEVLVIYGKNTHWVSAIWGYYTGQIEV